MNIDDIRNQLIDYYGSATSFFPIAMGDVVRVEMMSDEEIINEALRLGFISYDEVEL